MFILEILETEDKSYYADCLAELTGKLRSHWGWLPLEEIKRIHRETLKRVVAMQTRKGDAYENARNQKTG
ncbi:MAG: hypothetical protein Q8P24_16440 [Desulfobacterales bacterium]|nr:hypothetical protein [Desulfobacterales bacterium]